MSYRLRKRRRLTRKKRLASLSKALAFGALAAGIVLVASLVFPLIVFAKVMAGLPSLEDLKPREEAVTSKVYASDGTLIAEFHAEENREEIPLEQVPLVVRQAVLAVEDRNFYKHKGFDIAAIVRAAIANLTEGKIVQGGSTLTQQYIRTVYLKPEPTLQRKLTEAYLAYQLEKKYSKDKILEMYLNSVYFGEGAYGIEAAAQTYFGIHAKDLNLSQAALLAGLPQSPNTLSPFKDIDAAIKRRNTVLDLMAEAGFISKQEAKEAKKTPVMLKNRLKEKFDFAPYFVEYVKQELIKEYGFEKVFKGGLRIYTTIDRDMQRKAEEAIKKTLFDKNDPKGALVAIDPKTGHIKAMVGGDDFENNKFNLATQSKRQPGSVFKVFVLVAALENNFSPYMAFRPNGPIKLTLPGPDWEVDNYFGQKFDVPYMSVVEATVHSVNVVYAQLVTKLGAAKVARIARDMGIESPVEPLPAIGLGGLTEGVSPLDLASAFSTLANGGVHVRPTAITKITDKDGNVLFNYKPSGKRVISEQTAYRVTQILRQVIERGTGTRANIGRPAAGKTGTTEESQDAWFVGYTPDLVAAVWMGYPQASVKMGTIRGVRVQGGSFPAMIWKEFMSSALQDIPPHDFPEPKDRTIRVQICKDSGKSPVAECPPESITTITVQIGQEPREHCDVHAIPQYPNVVGMPQEQAIQLLESIGYKVVPIEQPNQAPKGVVFGQNPDPTRPETFGLITKGMEVQIAVSQGPG